MLTEATLRRSDGVPPDVRRRKAGTDRRTVVVRPWRREYRKVSTAERRGWGVAGGAGAAGSMATLSPTITEQRKSGHFERGTKTRCEGQGGTANPEVLAGGGDQDPRPPAAEGTHWGAVLAPPIPVVGDRTRVPLTLPPQLSSASFRSSPQSSGPPPTNHPLLPTAIPIAGATCGLLPHSCPAASPRAAP